MSDAKIQETNTTDTTAGHDESKEVKTEAGKTEERLFTQAEVDRIVAKRLARAVPSDYDDLKAKAERLAELESKREAEIEAAVQKAVDETTRKLTEEHLAQRVLDKIEVAAAGKFADVEDARLRLKDRVGEFVKDGEIDLDGITKALDEILDKHPHLKAAPTDARQVGLGLVSSSRVPVDVSPGLGRLVFAYSKGDETRSRK